VKLVSYIKTITGLALPAAMVLMLKLLSLFRASVFLVGRLVVRASTAF
jgi:hypothetical protein